MKKAFQILAPVFVCLIVILGGCKKNSALSEVPEISLVSVNPTAVTAYQDSIVFTIFYRDGDGDLGENDPNAQNVFLVDKRINATHSFRVKQLAPDGSNIAIQGTLEVILNNTGITNSSSSQSATFDIYVTDRAGNNSNIVTSDAITITQ